MDQTADNIFASRYVSAVRTLAIPLNRCSDHTSLEEDTAEEQAAGVKYGSDSEYGDPAKSSQGWWVPA